MNKQLDFSKIWHALGQHLSTKPQGVELAKLRSIQENAWFTADHIDFALNAIRSQYLEKEKLDLWLSNYDIGHAKKRVNVGIVCAGNIPLVGFHDVMCVITSGHTAVVKLSHKDQFLIPALISELLSLFPELSERVKFVNRLENYDAILATGSNNSQRYFKSYFGHVPHIFRHNRTSAGIIHEADDLTVLKSLSAEIFMHFGLGCRSISKLFIPADYNLDNFFSSTLDYSNYGIHTKYNNNFMYHTALFQMNKVDYITNDLLILLETDEWHSPLSIVYYERYNDEQDLINKINPNVEHIQAIYSSQAISGLKTVIPGLGQQPQLNEYADHVDTLEWLLSI